jgi:hypothetical protein
MSNVRLITNVICQALRDEEGKTIASRKEADLVPLLTYFELRGLNRAWPYHFPSGFFERDRLTRRQIREIDAWLREDSSLLWPEIDNFSTPYFESDSNPFFVQKSDRQRPTQQKGDSAKHEQAPDEAKVIERISLESESESESEIQALVPDTPEDQSTSSLDNQQVVIELGSGVSAIVLAPPGTGKTHLLIERLGHLIQSSDFDSPADQIAVLSFTNAAVTEVKKRLAVSVETSFQDDLRYVNVRTFDSFATKALLAKYDPVELPVGDHNSRIRMLVDELQNNRPGDTIDIVDSIKYLIVDEIQDLSGVRGELVLAMLSRVLKNGGAGLLLGDPCQAIYDWDMKDKPDGFTSQKFLSAVLRLLEENDSLNEFSLDRYWRFQNEGILDFISLARQAMGPYGDTPNGIDIARLIRSAGSPIGLNEIVTGLRKSQVTGLLTRSNLQAFQISQWLRDIGIDHVVSQGSPAFGWPAWISSLLLGWKQDQMRLDTLRKRLNVISGPNEVPSYEECVEYCRHLGAVNGGSLDVSLLSYLVSSQRAPMASSSGEYLVVSTIHKSKGLEYDNVFLVSPSRNFAGDAEEVRVVYVAATRARKEFRLMEFDSRGQKKGRKQGDHFFVDMSHLNSGLRTSQILFNGLEELDAFSCFQNIEIKDSLLSAESFRETQKKLWESWQDENQNFVFEARNVKYNGYERLALVVRQETRDWNDGEFVAFFNREVLRDIYSQFRHSGPADIRLLDIPVSRLQSIGFGNSEQSTKEHLGRAEVGLLPVLSGLANVEFMPL